MMGPGGHMPGMPGQQPGQPNAQPGGPGKPLFPSAANIVSFLHNINSELFYLCSD